MTTTAIPTALLDEQLLTSISTVAKFILTVSIILGASLPG